MSAVEAMQTVSGTLSQRDLKRLTGATRSGTVGPTTVYYAGVTVPIISAGVALFARTAFDHAGLTPYWTYLLSAMIAAFSGLSWYFIFMRWSYRQTHGRGDERDAITVLTTTDTALVLERGHVRSEIGWPAIQEVRRGRKFIALIIDGSDTLLIPDRWFGKDKVQRDAFHKELRLRAQM